MRCGNWHYGDITVRCHSNMTSPATPTARRQGMGWYLVGPYSLLWWLKILPTTDYKSAAIIFYAVSGNRKSAELLFVPCTINGLNRPLRSACIVSYRAVIECTQCTDDCSLSTIHRPCSLHYEYSSQTLLRVNSVKQILYHCLTFSGWPSNSFFTV